MKLKLFIALSFIITSCSTVRLRYVAELEDKESNETLVYRLEESKPVGSAQTWCILTGILYGGYCWAYLGLPDEDTKKLFMSEARKNFDSRYLVLSENVNRISWEDRPREENLIGGNSKSFKTEQSPKHAPKKSPQPIPTGEIHEFHDDISGITFYIAEDHLALESPEKSYLSPVIGVTENGQQFYVLRVQAKDEKTIHYDSITIRCESQRITLQNPAFESWQKDFDSDCNSYGCTSWEKSKFHIDKETFDEITSCREEVSFRFNSSSSTRSVTERYNENEVEFFKVGSEALLNSKAYQE